MRRQPPESVLLPGSNHQGTTDYRRTGLSAHFNMASYALRSMPFSSSGVANKRGHGRFCWDEPFFENLSDTLTGFQSLLLDKKQYDVPPYHHKPYM